MAETCNQNWVKVYAPATIANLGPLFDVGGLALRGIGNQVWARVSSEPGIKLQVEGLGNLSNDPQRNAVGVVASFVLELLQDIKWKGESPPGLELLLKDEIPVGSGLGSSAASSVAAALAVNLLHGNELVKAQQVLAARIGERFVSGSGHADNVAPAFLGGLVLVPCYDPDDYQSALQLISLPLPASVRENLHLAIVRPHIQVNTLGAREALKQGQEPIREMVEYAGAVTAELACGKSPQCERYREIRAQAAEGLSKAAGGNDSAVWKYIKGAERLVRALMQGDLEEVGRAVEQDEIITRRRALFIKDGSGKSLYNPVLNAAHESGAYGCSICGSGPSIFAITGSEEKAFAVSDAMSEVVNRAGVECHAFISTIDEKGSYALA